MTRIMISHNILNHSYIIYQRLSAAISPVISIFLATVNEPRVSGINRIHVPSDEVAMPEILLDFNDAIL